MRTNVGIYFTLLVISALVGFSACTKKKAADTPFTRIQGKWKLSSLAIDNNGNGKVDPGEQSPVAKVQDNEITFNNDLTGVETNVYNGVTSPPLNFTWRITNEDSAIQCAFIGHDTVTYYLVSVSSDNLTLQEHTTQTSPEVSWYYFNRK